MKTIHTHTPKAPQLNKYQNTKECTHIHREKKNRAANKVLLLIIYRCVTSNEQVTWKQTNWNAGRFFFAIRSCFFFLFNVPLCMFFFFLCWSCMSAQVVRTIRYTYLQICSHIIYVHVKWMTSLTYFPNMCEFAKSIFPLQHISFEFNCSQKQKKNSPNESNNKKICNFTVLKMECALA